MVYHGGPLLGVPLRSCAREHRPYVSRAGHRRGAGAGGIGMCESNAGYAQDTMLSTPYLRSAMRSLPSLAWVSRPLSALVLLCGVATLASAQAAGSIRGKITEAGTLVPVASATVNITGTRIGALTTNDGAYLLREVAAGTHTVRVTRIGFVPITRTVAVTAGQETVADFEVAKTAVQLEQIVTTATGEQSRRSVGNAVAVIDTDSLVRTAGVTNPMEILTARVSGVSVVQGSGMIGSAPSVVIRGRTSVFASSDPLWIIDGMRMVSEDGRSFSQNGNSTIASLSPEDIESIDVIKGPSATAL